MMPGRGIPHRVMTTGPWLPSWHKSLNQKYLPADTEFIYFDYDAADGNMSMISKEMEKVGVFGAEKAYNLMRPFSFKKDIF